MKQRKTDRASSKTIVLTYFEAFAGDPLNSSKLLVETLARNALSEGSQQSINFLTVELPVVFKQCSEVLESFLMDHNWDGLLMWGQASKRKKLSLELRAKNIIDPRFPDNSGQTPRGKIIPADDTEFEIEFLQASWPFESIISNLSSAIWELSEDAGEYVCNELCFRQLHKYRASHKPIGFVHVPLIEPQPNAGHKLEELVNEAKAFLSLCGRHLEK